MLPRYHSWCCSVLSISREVAPTPPRRRLLKDLTRGKDALDYHDRYHAAIGFRILQASQTPVSRLQNVPGLLGSEVPRLPLGPEILRKVEALHQRSGRSFQPSQSRPTAFARLCMYGIGARLKIRAGVIIPGHGSGLVIRAGSGRRVLLRPAISRFAFLLKQVHLICYQSAF